MPDETKSTDSGRQTPLAGQAQDADRNANAVGARRWIYGANTAILIVILIGLVAGLDYLGFRFNHRQDFTTGQIYSLSPKTHSLVKLIAASGKKYQLVNMYLSGGGETASEQASGDRVERLLREYTRLSSALRIYQPHSRRELDRTIKARFADQFKPYRATAREYKPLGAALNAFFKREATQIGLLAAQAGVSNAEQQQIVQVQSAFAQGAFPQASAQLARDVRHGLTRTLPHWPTLIADMQTNLQSIEENLQYLTDPATVKKAGSILGKYLQSRQAAYKKQVAAIKAYNKKLVNLKPLKGADVLHQLSPDSVVIIGPHSVKSIPDYQLFRANPGGSGSRRIFQGEQAVNAALLAMVHPQKTKVVFVSTYPGDLTNPQSGLSFARIASDLRRGNFKFYQWSPGEPSQQNPNASPTPPAMGKGVIWVVIGLPPMGQQQFMAAMQLNMLQRDVAKHLKEGGSALFLLGSMPEQIMQLTGGELPYKSLLAQYGVRIRPLYTVVQRFAQQQGGHQKYVLAPETVVTRYPPGPITGPLGSLATRLMGVEPAPGVFLLGPTVVEPIKNFSLPNTAATQPGKPKSAAEAKAALLNKPVVKVILQSPVSEDVWAVGPGNGSSTQFKPGEDLAPPVPMGVSVSTPTSRLVVFGGGLMVSDDSFSYRLADVYGQLTPVEQYPGNAQLFMNSMYWLAHESQFIGVSPRATVALRIAAMSSTEETTVRLISFLGPAVLVVLAGIAVFLVRRRV